MSTSIQYTSPSHPQQTAAQLRQTCKDAAAMLSKAQDLLQRALGEADERALDISQPWGIDGLIRRNDGGVLDSRPRAGLSPVEFGQNASSDSLLPYPATPFVGTPPMNLNPPISKPSCFCLDIIELEGMVRQQMIVQAAEPLDRQQSLDTLVQKMLRLTVSKRYWGWTRQWYTETIGFEKLEAVTRYRVAPTVGNYLAIQPELRPTELQLTRFHWPMVDWVPFPGVRDNLILHANEVDLTDVLLTSMHSYCLESILDTSVHSQSSQISSQSIESTDPMQTSYGVQVYYRLTEYIEYVNRPHQSTPVDGSNLPPESEISKSVEAEFVLALRKQLGIFKLESTFFERFPLLYSEEALVKGTYRSIYNTPS